MAECITGTAPTFEIPEDQTTKEKLLEILGYEEIEITATDINGNSVTAVVPGVKE